MDGCDFGERRITPLLVDGSLSIEDETIVVEKKKKKWDFVNVF